MAVNKDVQNFYELRAGLAGMAEQCKAMLAFSEGALYLLNQHGIGVVAAGGRNGNGSASLREKVKRAYAQSRGDVPSTPKLPAGELKRQQREATAALLSGLDTTEPRPLADGARGIGPLIRHGYIRKKGDGYIRTAKPYQVAATEDQGEASTNGNNGHGTIGHGHGNNGSSGDAMTLAEVAKALKMSEANVRLMVKAKKLKSHTEQRPRKGTSKLQPLMVIAREELARYRAAEG